MNAPAYNFAYLNEQTKRMIRRAILKAIAVPGYQVPFASREMPMPYGWGTGGVQVTAAVLTPEDTLKVIVANPTMIKAYRAGVPENGKHFPDGAKIAKIEWSTQKDAESPFPVWVPDTLKGVGFIAKDSKRFPDSGGWGYAQFKTDVSGALMPDGSGTKCGFACHSTVAAKDYIFTGYAPR